MNFLSHINESYSKAETYVKKGLLSDEELAKISELTHKDNFTKFAADVYIYLRNSYLSGNISYDTNGGYIWKKVMFFHDQAKNYHPNIFPINGIASKGEFNDFAPEIVDHVMLSLERRNVCVKALDNLPGIAKRNWKNEIRQPRKAYELYNLGSDLSYMVNLLSLLNNREDTYKRKIYARLFKSENTMKDSRILADDRKELIGGINWTKSKVSEIIKSLHWCLELVWKKESKWVVKVTDKEGITALGKGSLWCFTYSGNRQDELFYNYSTNDIVYLIIDWTRDHTAETTDDDFMVVIIKPLVDGDPNDDSFDDDSMRNCFNLMNEPVYHGEYTHDVPYEIFDFEMD